MLAGVQIPPFDFARGQANNQLLSGARLLVRMISVRSAINWLHVLNSLSARPVVRTFCSSAILPVLLVVRLGS